MIVLIFHYSPVCMALDSSFSELRGVPWSQKESRSLRDGGGCWWVVTSKSSKKSATSSNTTCAVYLSPTISRTSSMVNRKWAFCRKCVIVPSVRWHGAMYILLYSFWESVSRNSLKDTPNSSRSALVILLFLWPDNFHCLSLYHVIVERKVLYSLHFVPSIKGKITKLLLIALIMKSRDLDRNTDVDKF